MSGEQGEKSTHPRRADARTSACVPNDHGRHAAARAPRSIPVGSRPPCLPAGVEGASGKCHGVASAGETGRRADTPPIHDTLDRSLCRSEAIEANLVGNAIKLTGRGGRIGVGAVPRDREVLFWVSDTGPGSRPTTCLACSTGSGRRGRRSASAQGSGCPSWRVGRDSAHGGARLWIRAPGRNKGVSVLQAAVSIESLAPPWAISPTRRSTGC